jgi:hypothetical protein
MGLLFNCHGFSIATAFNCHGFQLPRLSIATAFKPWIMKQILKALAKIYFTKMLRILIIPVLLMMISSCGNNNILKEVKRLDHYPSASAIEFLNKQFYIMGDDASSLLILDSNLMIIDSVKIYSSPEKRISKAIKSDLEAMALVKEGRRSRILMMGSGSLAPYRNIALLFDPESRQIDSIRMDTLYQRFLLNGLKEINIEGACTIPGSLVFANRGHKGYPKNYLVFAPVKCWENQAGSPLFVAHMGGNTDSLTFSGISGIAYAPKGDRLIMTVSTENTSSVLEDGTIGKSYLWIVKNISTKKRWKAINPEQVIDLDELDARFKGQKIESVTVTSETRRFLHLVLAADNDDGSSTLFKMIIEKK